MKKKFLIYFFGLVLLGLFFFRCSTKSTPTPTPTILPPIPLANLTNVSYGQNTDWVGNSPALVMNLFFPAGATTALKYPLVVLVHGASFLVGKKEDLDAECQILADSGFVAATIDYRLGWNVGTGSCAGDTLSQNDAVYRATQDLNAALRFLVSQASNYAIDTTWIFTGGQSAGAVTALNSYYATPQFIGAFYSADSINKLGSLVNSDNALTNSYSIKGICSMWGALPDSNLVTRQRSVPTIFFHGTADMTVPVDHGYNKNCTNYSKLYGSLCLYRRLAAAGKPAIAHILIGGGHQPAQYSASITMPNTSCFFKSVITRNPIQSKVLYGLDSNCP